MSNLPLLTRTQTHQDLLEQVESFSKAEAGIVLAKLRQTLKEAEKSGDRIQVSWILVYIAMTLRGQRQYSAAFKLLDKALRVFETASQPAGMGWVYHELSIANREVDRNALALDYAHKALRYFQEAGTNSALCWVYDNFARIHMNQYNRPEALTFAKKARTLFVEFQSKSGLAWNACNLGGLYTELGSYDKAEEFYREALGIFEKNSNRQGQGWALLGIAFSNRRQSKFEKAREYLGRAKDVFKENDLKDRVAWCMLHEAAIDRLNGKIADAIQINKQAIQYFSHMRSRDGVAWGLFQMGQIYRDQGMLIKSWQTFREANNLHTDIANREGIGWSENDWGEIYLELNDLSHARENFIKAKVIGEQLDTAPLKITVDDNLSHLYLEEGFVQKAINLSKESEAAARKFQIKECLIKVLMEQARQLTVLNEIEKAQALVDEAKSWTSTYQINVLGPWLNVYSGELKALQGQVAEAAQIFSKTIEEASEFQQRRARAEACLGLIQLWRLNRTPLDKILVISSQLAKDIKVVGSRKLKAKYLAVKALIEFAYKKKVDVKGINECIRVLESAGLVTLQYQMLKFFEDIYKKTGMELELRECREKLKEILDRNPVDLYLVQPRFEDASPLPISLSI